MSFLRRIFGRDVKTDTAVQNGYTLVADDTKTSGLDWSDILVRAGLGRDLVTGINSLAGNSYNLDTVFLPGEYYFDIDTLGGKPCNYGLLKVWRESSVVVYQIVQSSDETNNRMFSRCYRSGTWGPWTEYASTANVPTPVSYYIEGSTTPGGATVDSTITAKGRVTIVAISGGGGGGGGGGASSGIYNNAHGGPGTGGGAGTKAIFEYYSDDATPYSIDISIPPAASGGAGGVGDGGNSGVKRPGSNGMDGGVLTITIKGSNPITLDGGKGGRGGLAYSAGTPVTPGSGVPSILISCSGSYLEVGATIALNSGKLTLVHLSTGGSSDISYVGTSNIPTPGGEGAPHVGLGYSRPGVSGGVVGTATIGGGVGGTATDQHQAGYGGGGGGPGVSRNGGTAGGTGGSGGRGCVTVYYV